MFFWHMMLNQKVNIWLCFAVHFVQRMNQCHQAKGMHLCAIILNYLLLTLLCQWWNALISILAGYQALNLSKAGLNGVHPVHQTVVTWGKGGIH